MTVASRTNLSVVLVHTVGLVQDAVHLHIVWVKGLLLLRAHVQGETLGDKGFTTFIYHR